MPLATPSPRGGGGEPAPVPVPLPVRGGPRLLARTAEKLSLIKPRQKQLEFMGLRGWYLASLLLVYTMSAATNLITYILKPIMLLYTNQQGWTSKTDTRYYTAIMVTTALLPILLNPVVTKWTDARSPKEVFVAIPLLCAAGLALMLVQDRWLYFAGITMTSGILSLRAARQAWILGAVPVAHTSRAMLILVVSFPIGSLLGPITAVGISRLWPSPDHAYTLPLGPYRVVLDQFTVVYAFCLAFMSLQVLLVLALFMDACQDDSVSVASSFYYYPPEGAGRERGMSYNPPVADQSFASTRSLSLSLSYSRTFGAPPGGLDFTDRRGSTCGSLSRDEETAHAAARARLSVGRIGPKSVLPPGAKKAPMWEDFVSEVDHNGRPVRVHSWDYTLRIFFCFAVWTFLINLTAGVFTQILNPVLVNRFGLQFAALSLVTTLHKVCSLLASLCAIPLAKHGRDSALIIVGVGLILAGILLFCWVPMHVSLVIAGSALVEQGTTFSLAMSVALMSKMLGRRAQGWAFGVFSSVLMLGKGVSTVVGGWVLQGTTIGTWSLALWGLPAFVVLLMLVHPNTQRFLDPERPLVKRMTHPEPPAASGAAGEEEVIVEITPDRGCAVM